MRPSKVSLTSSIDERPSIGERDPIGEKRPILAAILTLIFMPVGYWYVKRLKRFLVVFLIAVVIGVLIGEAGVYILMAIAIYDVYRLAKDQPAPFDFLGRWGFA